MRLLVASANPHKVAELRVLLCETLPDVELVLRPPGVPDVDETSDTLEGNARLKAAALVRATGLAAVATEEYRLIETPGVDARRACAAVRRCGFRAAARCSTRPYTRA